jgi:hypothetical protein
MNRPQKYPFFLNMFGLESKVRGLYLTVACDFENLMSDVIAICEETDISQRSINRLKHPYEMGAKLERCKKAVEDYNKVYFKFFIPEFEVIGKLVKYRTMLAHGFSEYDNNELDKTYIIFNWVIKENGKKEMKEEKIIINPFIKEIVTYRKHVFQFMKLHATLEGERSA